MNYKLTFAILSCVLLMGYAAYNFSLEKNFIGKTNLEVKKFINETKQEQVKPIGYLKENLKIKEKKING